MATQITYFVRCGGSTTYTITESRDRALAAFENHLADLATAETEEERSAIMSWTESMRNAVVIERVTTAPETGDVYDDILKSTFVDTVIAERVDGVRTK